LPHAMQGFTCKTWKIYTSNASQNWHVWKFSCSYDNLCTSIRETDVSKLCDLWPRMTLNQLFTLLPQRQLCPQQIWSDRTNFKFSLKCPPPPVTPNDVIFCKVRLRVPLDASFVPINLQPDRANF
jgi:hypothetical protein